MTLGTSAIPFGRTAHGEPVEIHTLANDHGMTASICTYGGIITSLHSPDRRGLWSNVVLGFETLDEYVADTSYCGALIGRYAGRIAGGRFALDGEIHRVPTNDSGNSLHGGVLGFGKVLWQVADADRRRLTLIRRSPAGEEGFPGTLEVSATYSLMENDAFQIDFSATTDAATVVNLTQHPYFNLRGHGSVIDHEVQIQGSRYAVLSEELIPTGTLRPVVNTPFDFLTARRIGERLGADDEQLRYGAGYDHTWVMDDWTEHGKPLRLNATVYEPDSGRTLEVLSTQPGLQFYTGNHLARPHTGFALEPQHFPDSPNQPRFPSVTLRPGARYAHSILYRFSVRHPP